MPSQKCISEIFARAKIFRSLSQNLKNVRAKIVAVAKKNPLKKDLDIINIKKDVRKLNLNDLPSNFDCIIHLAGFTDVQYCQQNPSKCFDVNVKGTQNMLEMARQKKSKFIFFDTIIKNDFMIVSSDQNLYFIIFCDFLTFFIM